MAKKWVYLFKEGDASMRNLLGGKGANLAEMTSLGLPVPQGFTITTEACTQYYEDGREINAEIQEQINEYIGKMEEITGKKFGDLENPLLVSVRSGARASMPGMMDTILNLGLNEDVVNVIAKKSGNPRWAWDCYRRFIQMYSDVVMEVGKKYFEELIDEMKEKKGVTQDVDLTAEDLKELANQFKAEYKAKIGEDFPTDPKVQLMGAIQAVFRSWDNPRANVYRRDNDIPYSWGTAVNVQAMAFGNMGENCGTGTLIEGTDNPGSDNPGTSNPGTTTGGNPRYYYKGYIDGEEIEPTDATLFTNGMAALTVYSDAYLFVIYQVDGQPGVQYMTTDYVDGPTHATLVTTGFEKMHVTAGTYTLYLYDNQDGTLELSTEPMAGKTLVSTGAQSVEQTIVSEKAHKVIIDGQLRIVRENKVFDLTGRQL